MSETFEEWRVTGDPGEGFPPYEFVWSRRLMPNLQIVPEVAARTFVARVGAGKDGHTPWPDGPHLSHRTVVVGPWEDTPV